MKNILFPTDFSGASINALPFALTIAKKTKARIVITHAYQVPANSSVIGIDIKRKAEKHIQNMLDKMPDNLLKKVSITPFVMRANTVQLLNHLAKGCDLVVMGTKQLSGWIDQIGGQITNALIKKTKTPVMAIPANCVFKKMKKIVLSLDEGRVNDEKGLTVLKELTRKFNAELMLFHTEEGAMDKGIHEATIACFDEQTDFHIDYNFVQNDVQTSIEEMAADYDVNLVSLVQRKRSFFASLFHNSITTQEIRKSRVPLLILHDG